MIDADTDVVQGDVDFAPSMPAPTPLHPAEILRAAETRKATPRTPMELADRLIEVMQSPERLQEVIDGVADPYDDHAPMLASDLRLATTNALTFLAQKAPRRSQPAPGLDPLEPPASEVRRFERYVKAVDAPLSILDDAIRGDLSSEAVEAVRTVYPQIFSMIQSQIAERLTNAKNIPYNRRMQLSALLGQDMTGTLNPRMGMMAQSVYGSAQQPPPQGKQQMPLSRAKSLGVSSREARETAAWREAQPQGAEARMRGVGSRF